MESASLTFLHISDTHIPADPAYKASYAPQAPYEGALALVEQIRALPIKPDFVLHTGDVASDPDPEAYANCRDILDQIPYPVYYVAGNHDESLALQQYMIPDQPARLPLHYSVDLGGVQLVVVDSNGPAQAPAGYITDQQLAWLREQCQPDDPRPLIVATHHNPIRSGIPWLDDFMGVQNGEDFHQAILPARERLRGVFFGHVHQNLDFYRDGILYCSTISSWTQFHAWPGQAADTTLPDTGAEPGFSVVTVSPRQTIIRRHRF